MIAFLLAAVWAGPSFAAFREISGCKEADYVFVDRPSITVEIAGLMYNPKCLKVKSGTSVTIQGLFRHQINAMPPFDGVQNPFKQDQPATTDQTRVLTAIGQYGIWCYPHGDENGEGMAAAFWVVP